MSEHAVCTGVVTSHALHTASVTSPVDYRVLRPSNTTTTAATDGLALILFLHGGGGSAEFLDTLQPVFERAWADGTLPPTVVATPSAGRSFYLDRHDGAQRWEQFLIEEFIPHLVDATGAGRGGDAVALAGISMGGLGSLRLAFGHPDRFVAVAAVEPAIEEATVWSEVTLRDRVYRDDAIIGELFGDPVDEQLFNASHPRAIAARNAHLIAAAGIDIYFECGDQDLLHLQYGAEALHRQLFAQGLDHEYRLVRRGNHLGATLPGRLADALRFIGNTLHALDRSQPHTDPEVEVFAQWIAEMETDRGYRRSEVIDGPGGTLEVHVLGEGPPVVMIPSLGRGAADFEQLAARLARSGYCAISPEPRGFGRSHSELDGVSMADLADDVAAVIRWAGNERATVVGHAFGNRVARMTATRHPELVESVVLLACGGRIPPSEEAASALRAVFDVELSDHDHLASVRTAFFAPGNDASVWFDGWNSIVAAAQSAATRDTSVETWWTAGDADVLVVQPADDVIAVAENGQHIVAAVGTRGSMVTIPDAGHALLPEQPAAVAATLLTWLHDRARHVEVESSTSATVADPPAGREATVTEAAARWAEALERWAIPEEILAQAPVSPWQHDTAMFAVDDTLDRGTPAAEIARAVLPASGGSVLDVGCGGGRAAMSLVPPAAQVIGVDQSPAMLAEFTRAAALAGASSSTIEGRWPDVAISSPTADVVVCHHVAYNVADIEPFLVALTEHARLAVVLVLPPRHPLSAWNDAWRHFWGIERPTEPTADDLAEILAGLGLDPERWDVPRPPLARATADTTSRVPSARRRLCLTEDRDDELAAYLDTHDPGWSDTNVVFRWPGAAGDD